MQVKVRNASPPWFAAVEVPYGATELRALLKAIPGCRYHSEIKRWQVPMEMLRTVEQAAEDAGLEWDDGRAFPFPAKMLTLEYAENYQRLHDFQKRAVFNALATGSPVRWAFADEMGLGKLQSKTSLVATPSGWRQIGDLTVGDEVMGSNGRPTKVVGVFPQGIKELFRMTLNDGCIIDSGAEHLWAVQTVNDRFRGDVVRIMSTQQLIDTGLTVKAGSAKWFIPVAAAMDYSEKTYEIHPYVLGSLIANGALTGATPDHTGSEEQRDLMRPYLGASVEFGPLIDGKTRRIRRTIGASNNDLGASLRALGLFGTVSNNKFIPKQFLFGSIKQRKELLAGLMDNGGTVSKDGMASEYNTVSPSLAADVLELVRSLGGVAWMSTRIPTYTYKGEKKFGQKDHRIRMALTFNPFKVKHKAERWRTREKYRPAHNIKSLESIGMADCVCIKVDAADSLYVTNDYVLTHNTSQAITTSWLRERKKILIVCPSVAKLNWVDELAKWWPDHPPVAYISYTRARTKGLSKAELARHTASYNAPLQIVSYALLHEVDQAGWDCIIFDEAHALQHPDSQQSEAALRLTQANPTADVLLLSATLTPDRVQDIYGPFSVAWPGRWGKLVQAGTYSYEFNHRYIEESVDDLGFRKWGAPREDTIDELRQRVEAVSSRTTKQEVAHLLPPYDVRVERLLDEDKHKAVVDWVLNALESSSHVAVLCHYRKTVKALAQAIAKALPKKKRVPITQISGDDDPNERFKKIKSAKAEAKGVVVATMHSCGIAIDLTFCTSACFAELCSRPVAVIQTLGRFSRLSGSVPSTCVLLVRADSPDERIAYALKSKIDQLNKVVKAGVTESAIQGVGKSEEEILAELETMSFEEFGFDVNDDEEDE